MPLPVCSLKKILGRTSPASLRFLPFVPSKIGEEVLKLVNLVVNATFPEQRTAGICRQPFSISFLGKALGGYGSIGKSRNKERHVTSRIARFFALGHTRTEKFGRFARMAFLLQIYAPRSSNSAFRSSVSSATSLTLQRSLLLGDA